MCLGCRTFAQVLVSGGTYVQNFDALTNNGAANWTNNFTLLGWYASKGNADATNFTLSAGTSTAGGIYSFAANGINSSADRALGSLGASSTTYAFGVRFTNNTAAVVTNLLISYVGEQWRSGSTTTPQTLAFAYQISSSPITNTYSASGWINFPALNFVTPNLSAAASPLDGNAATNRVLFVNVALTNLAVGPGQEIFLRWLDVDDAGFDNAVAIDDLTVSFGTNTAPVGTPPFIITQPQSQTVAAGDNVTFTVTVTGMAPFSFQWQSNNVIIPHATNSTFTLNSVTTNFTGSSYFVTVTNEVGATNSQTATLTVNAALVPTASANTNGDITLMTYNLAGNGATNWSTNAVQVQAIGRQLLYLQPDVVTFNEIPHNYLYEMTNWVTAFLPGYNLVVSSGTDGFIHSGIATRFPMARSQKWLDGVDLNPFGYTNANYTRDLFEVEVAVPNWPLPLHVFTTHLKSSASGYTDAAAKRAAEAAAVTNFFATNFFVLYPNHPFTLSGDMNEGDTNTTAIQELLSAPMTLRLTRPTNSVTGSINTYTIRGSVSERIDYIFPCAFLASNIVGGQVFRTDLLTNLPPNLFANDDKDASDHLPVLLTFANPFNTPFKLLAVARTNQSVTLQWESQKNRTFRIEASTNLVNWFAFTTNLLTTTTNSPYVFTTNNVSDRIKFFRIYRVP
jgi:endonuclease/exonuclease/phosphatase family metal-dependent hydrolase